MQILVLGMHRSGTSIVTRLINMMGAYFAPEGASHGFTKDNAKGFWERRDVMQLNQRILRYHKLEWNDLGKWSKNAPLTAPLELSREIKTLILNLDAFRPWVLKDPRMCLTLSAWLPHLEVPVAVIVSRDPREIALSLKKRNGLDLNAGLELWEAYATSALQAVAHLPKVYAKHEEFLADPVVAVSTLYEDLCAEGVQGLRLPSPREVQAFVAPELQHAHAAANPLTLNEKQLQLYARMRGGA